MNRSEDPRPVHVVVVAYHQPALVRRCLQAARPQTPTDAVSLTVVDNSGSAEIRSATQEGGAQYLAPDRNLGFGGAVNVALRRIMAGPPADVLLLNPDARLPCADIVSLAAELHHPDNDRVGAMSPALRHPDGSDQRVMWPFPSPGLAWAEAIGLVRRTDVADGFAVGAALLLRWEALHEVGFFDERFFLYAEETDWQRRARDLGWHARVVPRLHAVHIGGASSSDELRRQALFHSGTETYQRKWFGRWGWQLYRGAVITGCLPRAVHPRRSTRRAAIDRAGLYARGPRRVAGLKG